MDFKVVDNRTGKRPPTVVGITTMLHTVLTQTESGDWESLFNEFRLNLQGRIVGSDGQTLLKLQGNLEYLNELEQFFKAIVKSP